VFGTWARSPPGCACYWLGVGEGVVGVGDGVVGVGDGVVGVGDGVDSWAT